MGRVMRTGFLRAWPAGSGVIVGLGRSVRGHFAVAVGRCRYVVTGSASWPPAFLVWDRAGSPAPCGLQPGHPGCVWSGLRRHDGSKSGLPAPAYPTDQDDRPRTYDRPSGPVPIFDGRAGPDIRPPCLIPKSVRTFFYVVRTNLKIRFGIDPDGQWFSIS